MKKLDLIGKRFGRLAVLSLSPNKTKDGSRMWFCQCDCGKTTKVPTAHLNSGGTQSCGCIRQNYPWHTKHGYLAGGYQQNPPRIYRAWLDMRQRCNNPNSQVYKYYGGRGISICPQWDDFTIFLKDMGEPLMGLSLDRINNDGNYEPTNCRWATASEQQRNKRKCAI